MSFEIVSKYESWLNFIFVTTRRADSDLRMLLAHGEKRYFTFYEFVFRIKAKLQNCGAEGDERPWLPFTSNYSQKQRYEIDDCSMH